MNWLFFSIATALLWGTAELFYKKGARPDEQYSHLKICVWVGVVMGRSLWWRFGDENARSSKSERARMRALASSEKHPVGTLDTAAVQHADESRLASSTRNLARS